MNWNFAALNEFSTYLMSTNFQHALRRVENSLTSNRLKIHWVQRNSSSLILTFMVRRTQRCDVDPRKCGGNHCCLWSPKWRRTRKFHLAARECVPQLSSTRSYLNIPRMFLWSSIWWNEFRSWECVPWEEWWECIVAYYSTNIPCWFL